MNRTIAATRCMFVQGMSLAFALGAFQEAFAGDGHGDFEVAQDGAMSHTLLIAGDPDILMGPEAIELPEKPSPLLDAGFAAQEPGFVGLEMDEPAEGLFALLPGNSVSLVRESFSPGFKMFDGALNEILLSDGAAHEFGSDPEGGFHQDLFYAADAGVGVGAMLSATFRLADPSGLHADSAPFTLNFITVPEPSAAGWVALGALALARRRRDG